MSQLRSALAMAAVREQDPSMAVDQVSAFAARLPEALGSTLVYVVLNEDRTITWCSAGHPPPLAEDANGLRYLSSPQRAPLAAQTQSAGPAETGALPPCGLLLLYSDGLVERRGEPFDASLDRLRATVAKHAELPVGQLCDAVLAEMRPEAGFPDDVALVAVRATGQTDSRFVDAFHATPAGLARSRRRLRDWLAGLEIPAGTLIDAVLAISEAAGNAMEHGSGNDPQQVVSVEVSLAGEDNALLAVVGDHGRWDADPTAGAARGRGRGLGIMDRLASELHVRRSRVGSTVTLRFDLPAAGEAPAGVRRPEPAD
jgi:anti-sigma regulatory factor (Ser/Thr protein kinase)